MENQHYVLHQLALVTGLQLTRSERELEDRFLADGDAGFDMAYEAVSPKLGLRYEFDRHTQVFANVSRSFEPPSFGELSGAQLVNVLAEQSATSFEIGSRGEYAPLATQWDLAWYHAAVEDEFLSLTDANGQPLGTVSAAMMSSPSSAPASVRMRRSRWVLLSRTAWRVIKILSYRAAAGLASGRSASR